MGYRPDSDADYQAKLRGANIAAERMLQGDDSGKLSELNKHLIDLVKHAREHHERLTVIRSHLYGRSLAKDPSEGEQSGSQREPTGALGLMEHNLRLLHETLNETDSIIKTLESL